MGKRRMVPYKAMVLEYADLIGKNVKSYREFGIAKSTFYEWRKAFRDHGPAGLIPKKPIAHHHPRALSQETIERILELRKTYCLGPQRIAWYLERYHGIKVSCASVYRTLVRSGERHLPRQAGRRAVHTPDMRRRSLGIMFKQT